MSTTTAQSPGHSQRQCDRSSCDATYPAGGGNRGYCSPRCWSIATAADLIRGIRFDHTFCASCFRRLRTVIPPGRAATSTDRYKDVPECAIGWAIPENHTITGDGEILQSTRTLFGMEMVPSDQTTRRRVCSCGVTHHATVERATLSKAECHHHVTRLHDALEDRRDRGAHEYDVDLDALRAAVLTLKSRRALAGDDALVFRHGLAVALRVGGT